MPLRCWTSLRQGACWIKLSAPYRLAGDRPLSTLHDAGSVPGADPSGPAAVGLGLASPARTDSATPASCWPCSPTGRRIRRTGVASSWSRPTGCSSTADEVPRAGWIRWTRATRPDAWADLVDDAAIFPPGDAPLHEATAAYGARSAEDGAELVGTSCSATPTCRWCAASAAPLSVVVHRRRRPARRARSGLCRKLGLDLAGTGDRAARPRRPGRQRASDRRGDRTRLETECAGLRRAAADRRPTTAGWPPPTSWPRPSCG